MSDKSENEITFQEICCRLPYRWATGQIIEEWYREIRENGRIVANKCPGCGRFHCPPRAICGRCHIKMEEKRKWIKVGPKGNLLPLASLSNLFGFQQQVKCYQYLSL